MSDDEVVFFDAEGNRIEEIPTVFESTFYTHDILVPEIDLIIARAKERMLAKLLPSFQHYHGRDPLADEVLFDSEEQVMLERTGLKLTLRLVRKHETISTRSDPDDPWSLRIDTSEVQEELKKLGFQRVSTESMKKWAQSQSGQPYRAGSNPHLLAQFQFPAEVFH